MTKLATSAVVATILVANVFACGSDPVSCEESATCAAPTGDGGNGTDAGPDVIVPEGCDLAKAPKDSPACVSDEIGVFVSPAGNDSGAGTKAAPVKTIGRALALTNGRPRVYVCEGTYAEAVDIKAPVAVHGGLGCDWNAKDVRPRIAPAKGIALRVTKVSGDVLVESVEVVGSADPAVPGDSAIGVLVSESSAVTLRGDVVRAGDGVAGVLGTTASNYATPPKDGVPALDGGAAVTCSCLDGATQSIGGKGGAMGQGGDRGAATPDVGGTNGGLGGGSCTNASGGANGVAKDGGVGSTTFGQLSATGWVPSSDATSGGTGNPGQGGGGGGGRAGVGAGGGGACGGCGGAGGNPGGQGGSSLGLLAFASQVTVDSGTVTTGIAGTGGIGAAGQAGQGGGAVGGIGVCDGAAGGHGAGGGGGGGGAGGHSVPIGFQGPEPKVRGTTLTPGTAASGGAGGAGGAGPGNPGTAGTKGADGKAQPTLAL